MLQPYALSIVAVEAVVAVELRPHVTGPTGNGAICQGLTPKNASATPRFRTASEPPLNRLRSS